MLRIIAASLLLTAVFAADRATDERRKNDMRDILAKFPELPKLQNGRPVFWPQKEPIPVTEHKDIYFIANYVDLIDEEVRSKFVPEIAVRYTEWMEYDYILAALEMAADTPIHVTHVTARTNVMHRTSIQTIFRRHPVRKVVLEDYSSFKELNGCASLDELGELLKSSKTLREFEASPRLLQLLSDSLFNIKKLTVSCDQFYYSARWPHGLITIFQNNPRLRSFKQSGSFCSEHLGFVLGVITKHAPRMKSLGLGPLFEEGDLRNIISYLLDKPKELRKLEIQIADGAKQEIFKDLSSALWNAMTVDEISLVFKKENFPNHRELVAILFELSLPRRKILSTPFSEIIESFSEGVRKLKIKSTKMSVFSGILSEILYHPALTGHTSKAFFELEVETASINEIVEAMSKFPWKKLGVSSLKIRNLQVSRHISETVLRDFAEVLGYCLSFDIQSNREQMSILKFNLYQANLASSHWKLSPTQITKESIKIEQTHSSQESGPLTRGMDIIRHTIFRRRVAV